MRPDLDETTVARIESILPDVACFGNRVLKFGPDFISMLFGPDSSVPVAAPCLEDAYHVACEARYSLREAYASLIWYREKSSTPNEEAAIWHARFYTTAAASCLYAAAEDVARAIIEMLEITKLEVPCKRNASLQVQVGKHLSKHLGEEAVTEGVCELSRSESWRKTMKWRNRWVHEQSQVRGLGIVYERKKRWERFKSSAGHQGFVLRCGGGDEPEYSVDDVLGFVTTAFSEFVRVLDKVLTRYESIVSSEGNFPASLR